MVTRRVLLAICLLSMSDPAKILAVGRIPHKATNHSLRQSVEQKKEGVQALAQFNIVHVREALAYLASDSLEGRETSEPGQKEAAAFIAKKFKDLGLKPLGDSGTFLQHFFVNVNYISDSSFVETDGSYYWGNKDIVVMPFGAGDTAITAPVVFAGYGFESDNYSDYDGMDVKGKIVILLDGNPPFADSSSIMIKTGLYKRGNAVKHGAAAVLLAVKGGKTGFAKIYQHFESLFGNKPMRLNTGIKSSQTPTKLQTIYIDEDLANQFLRRQGTDLEIVSRKLDSLQKPESMMLGSASVYIKLESETRLTENVIGMIEGTSLKNEYVVYSAHYDHLGKSPEGDVYHGADDNASGTCTVLGIAEMYAKSNLRPKRSVIFLTVTGEEKGLLGSDYFTAHPTVPIANIVADLNTDMDGRIDTSYLRKDSNYVFVIGSKRLSKELDSLLVSADSESVRIKLDYSFDSDNDPNQFYYRSDQYNFARRNIPVVFFFDGNIPEYHKPTDTIDKIDFPILEERAKLIFLTGWKAANLDWRLLLN